MSATESPAELLERLSWERERAARPALVHIAISGGRDRTPGEAEMDAFWKLWDRLKGDVLHHGDCPNPLGTDQYVARAWQERTGRKPQAHPADWKARGKAAGPIRSREMMTHCSALIAFPGGSGTQGCIKATRDQGKPVYFVGEPSEITPPARRPATVRRERPSPSEADPEDSADGPCPHKRVDWTFWPSQAAWLGRCYRCGRKRWASKTEANELERAAEKAHL